MTRIFTWAAALGLTAGLTAALTGSSAAAQDWVAGTDGGWSGAIACNASADVCLALGCEKGGPATWELWFSDESGRTAPVDFWAEIRVDRTRVGDIGFSQDPALGVWVAPMTMAGDAIVSALQRGNRGQVVIASPGEVLDLDVGLAGSWVALDHALLACPARADGPFAPLAIPAELTEPSPQTAVPEPAVPTTAAPAPVKPGVGAPLTAAEPAPSQPARATLPVASGAISANPAADAYDTVTADCQLSGGPVIGAGFVSMGDFDGDRLNDVVVRYSSAGCTEIPSYYCGSAGCPTQVWLGTPDGAFVEVFNGYAQDVETVAPDRVEFIFHGSACNLSGFEGCTAVGRLGNGTMVQAD